MTQMKEKMTKFEASARQHVSISIACAIILFGTTLYAQERSGIEGRPLESWTLGIARAVRMPASVFSILPQECSTEEMRGILNESETPDHPLSDSLAILLYNHIRPLPDRYAKDVGAKDTFIPIIVQDPGKNGFVSFDSSISDGSLQALLLILYQIEGNEFKTKTYYIDSTEKRAFQVSNITCDIEDLDSAATKATSTLFSVLANYNAITYDFDILPKSALVKIDSTSNEQIPPQIKGSRLFLHEGSTVSIQIQKDGYSSKLIENLGLTEQPYQRIGLKLEREQDISINNISDSLHASIALLDWKKEEDYKKASKKFLNAIGRVVITVPLAIVSLGSTFSYYEAFSRSAATREELIISGIVGAASIAATSLCLIDMSLQLGRRIKASK